MSSTPALDELFIYILWRAGREVAVGLDVAEGGGEGADEEEGKEVVDGKITDIAIVV